MNCRTVFALLFAVMALLFASCGAPRHAPQKAACVVGADTLSLSEIKTMEPDSGSPRDKISRAALEMTLSREARLPCGNVKDTGFYSDLSNQLSLHTGSAWSAQSAACLYSAAKAVRMKFMSLPDAKSVGRYVDSLFSATVSMDTTAFSRHMMLNDSTIATMDNKKTRQDLEKLLRSIFKISEKTAFVLADFLISEKTEKPASADVSSLIKGLVADGKHKQQAASEPAPVKPVVVQDPALALKYRPQQVISDSIKKHIHNLEALFKKQLKTHPDLSGTVWVTFVILPDGSVATAQVHSTDISEKDFLSPFSHYVERIRFSKIPDAVGPMTFEFPFEFSPEN